MPAGTWNLGRLRKRVDYVGLKDLGISLIDQTVNSDNYFNIIEFPNQLTGGKNLFKIKASANTLVKDSKIHIEVLDSNGSPIYYEPINYLEADGTRVIAVYVYPDTPYGSATIYVAGRAQVDLNGRRLRSSQDVNDPDYINFPNVLWQRSVTVAPERLNSTEIIFTQQPSITLQEVVQPYLQPVNLTNVATQSFGVGTCTIRPKPQQQSITRFEVAALAPAIQGSGTRNSPPSFYGNQLMANPASVQVAADRGVVNIGSSGPTSGTTSTIITALDESIFETSVPFFTSDMGQGDVITIVNPNIEVPSAGPKLNSEGLLVPDSQASTEGFNSAAPGLIFGLSGSYNFVIDTILSTKKAQVVLLENPAGFKNIADSNTGGKFAVTLTGTGGGGIIGNRTVTVDKVEPTANYTCSFTLPFVTEITEQSQSFAEIKISNIEPATGDVYKLKTFYKAGGQFGDFIDAGEVVLEQVEILEDQLNYEANASDGATYNRMGFFSSLGDYQTYFTSSGGIIPPTVPLAETFEPDDLLSGIRLTPTTTYGPNDFSYIRLKDSFKPSLTKNTQYLMTVNLFADSSNVSTDPNVGPYPQLDIYVSGSKGRFNNDEMTVNAYIKQPFGTVGAVQGYEESLTGIFESDQTFGTRIGSVQINSSGSIVPAIFRFESLDDQEVEFYFVQRSGRYNIGNISVKTFNESKFTPNFTRINTRIPTQFIKTPLTFKLLFYDYLNNQAEAEAIIYPVTFTGENSVFGGNNDIITGTMTVGNVVGEGIELVGQNSAYIRSIGYDGFNKAKLPENQGGFLMYTGSIEITGSDGTGDTDSYQGVGLEIVADSGSFLRFATQEVSGKAAGLEIRTPKFFLGDENTQISGSNGNIKISGSNLDLRSDSFFLGGQSAFISGANGNIEITSSGFHLDENGDVILQGTITADAGGSIGGFTIGTSDLTTTNFSIDAAGRRITLGSGNDIFVADGDDGIFLGNASQHSAPFAVNLQGALTASSGLIGGFEIGTSQLNDTSDSLILKDSGQITGSNVLFSGGKIAGWSISTSTIQKTNVNGGVKMDSTNKRLTFRTGSAQDTEIVFIGNLGSNRYGIKGLDATDTSKTIFKLGEEGNEIAGWTLTDESLTGGQMIIRKDGTIESAGFASNVAGSGFRLTANQGGFLEVENARIRGTLATTVFEKEAVNAVGGQLYVANSSTLTGSAVAPNGVHSATTTTMSLENVSGFSPGEILTAKKVSSTGFATEYMLVNSSSRFDKSSETNFGGFLFVQRGYGAGTAGDSGSLGDLASVAQSYSGSQVIVSTGKIGTGYIRLNANPNDPFTPYIDIVERTGSAIYDIDLKARLGDLSGLSQARLHGTDPTNAGFGLYSQNVFLEGGIVANTGSIAGIEMESGKLYTGEGNHANTDTGFYIDSGSKFSLGDKLTWDGTALTVRGQLRLNNGTPVGNGMVWSGSWEVGKTYNVSDAVEYSGSSYIAVGSEPHVASHTNRPPAPASWSLMAGSGSDGIIGSDGFTARSLLLTLSSNVMVFDNSSDTSATPDNITFTIQQQNLHSTIPPANISIVTNTGANITGFAYDTGSIVDEGGRFSGQASGSITWVGSISSGGLAQTKGYFPITITVTSGSVLSDSATIAKIQGGDDGSQGTAGTDAKLLSLETSTFTFVKALDGTITPATASITASLQNTTSATASYETVPAVTLLTGSLLDLTRMELTKGHFGTNTSVRITANGDSGAVTDSVTFVLLDEGSGNIQTTLSNPSHTFQSDFNGNVTSFDGGGSELNVFEGATALTYKTTTPAAGQFSASLNAINITPGSITGNNSTTAVLNTPSAMSAASGALHVTITGKTQNDTAFTSSVTQSFAKSLAGETGTPGTNAKGVIVNGSTLIFTKAIDGTITPSSATFTASLNGATDDGAWSTTAGTLSGISNDASDTAAPPVCTVNSADFVDGMKVTYTMASADNSFADSVTLKLIDAGSGNVQTILSNTNHTFLANSQGIIATGSAIDFNQAGQYPSSSFNGDTTVHVFEGATKIPFTASFASSSNRIETSVYTNQALPLNWRSAPSGTFADTSFTNFSDNMSLNGSPAENAIAIGTGPFGEQELLWECYPDFADGPDGGWNSSVFDVDKTSAYLFIVYSKRHVHQNSGSFYWGWRNVNSSDSHIKYGTSTGAEHASSTNPYFMSGTNTHPEVERWYLHVGIVHASGSNPSGNDQMLCGTYDLETKQKVKAGSTYTFTTDTAKASHRCYHYYNRLGGYPDSPGSTPGDSGSLAASGSSYKVKYQTMALPAVYKVDGTEPSIEMLLNGHRVTPETEAGKRIDIRVHGYTGSLSETLTVFTSGSTQNGTAFDQQTNTISYNKSIAGAENIQAEFTNPTITLPGNASGVPTSFDNSGTTISVFEGAVKLQSEVFSGNQPAGKFEVSASGLNITPGAASVSGQDIVIADHSSVTATSGSITYTIQGKTSEGINFTRTKIQPFSVSTAGDVGATGATGPNFDFLSGSLSEIDTTGGLSAGLLLTSDVLGFHNAISQGSGPPYNNASLSNFTSYLDSGGNFYLGSGSGDLGAGYFAWNNDAKSLLISGSAVDIRVDKFYLGRSNQFISGANGNVEIKSTNFHLTPQGDITASAGAIGGFEIGSTIIRSATDQNSDGTDDTFVNMGSTMRTTSGSFKDPLGFAIYRNDNIAAIGETKIIRMGQIAPKDRAFLSGSTELGFTIQKRVRTGGDSNGAYKDIVRFGQDETFIGGEVRIGGVPEVLYFEDFSRSTTLSDFIAASNNNPTTNGSNVTFHVSSTGGLSDSSILTGQTDTVEGSQAIKLGNNSGNDQVWSNGNFLIPYDGVSLYEIEVRVKVTADTSQDSLFYSGFVGYAADATTKVNFSGADSFSSQHYLAASGKRPGANYETFKGYARGFSAGNADSSNKHYRSAPGNVHADVRFVAPMFLANHNGDDAITVIDYIKVTKYEDGPLRVGAGGITTGLLESFNFNADSGSRIDLNNGVIKLGGNDNPGFSVDELGFVKATNFAEKVVEVDINNRDQYFEDVSNSGVRLVFDGSLGGDVTMNMQLSVAPHNFTAGATKPIKDIKLPQQATDDYSSVRVIVATSGVQFDNGSIGATIAESTFVPGPPP